MFFLLLVNVFILGLTGFTSGAVISDDLHLNIQTTNSTGSVVTGTFAFVFNISTVSDCTTVVYSNSTSLTTDTRGIISYYLPNVSLDYSQRYYLCYYRNGTLQDSSQITRTPYTFRARNITISGLEADANLSLTGFNITADTGFFSFLGNLVNRITKIFATDADISNNLDVGGNLTVDTNTLFVDSNSNNTGIGTTSPADKLTIVGTLNTTNIQLASNCADGQVLKWSGGVGTCGTDDSGGGGGGNPFDQVLNTTSNVTFNEINVSLIRSDNWLNVTITESQISNLQSYILTSNEGNLNVNRSDWWDNLNTPADINAADITDDGTYLLATGDTATGNYTFDTNTLFIDSSSNRVGIGTTTPQNLLNVVGDLNVTGTIYGTNATFNGGWENNGVSIIDGDIYAQTGFFYNITSLNVTQQDLSIIEDLIVFGNAEIKKNLTVDTNTLFIDSNTGRVGIGTITPQNTLNVVGNLNVTGTIFGVEGNITDTYVPYTGAFKNVNLGNNNFTIGTSDFFVNSNNDKIGIGTASPVALLDVNGKIKIGNDGITAAAGMMRFTGTAFEGYNGTDWLVLGNGSSSGGTTPWTENGSLIYYTGGNVGIGITNPSELLDVSGVTDPTARVTDTTNTVQTILQSQDTIGYVGTESVHDLGLITNNTVRITINGSSGNVGIGTTTPQTNLHVLEDGTAGTPSITAGTTAVFQRSGSAGAASYISIISGNAGLARVNFGDSDSENQGLVQYNNSNNEISLWTVGLERFTVDSSGNVGIGTTSPTDKLTVVGTLNTTNIQLASNCADGQVLKWSGGVGTCGTDADSGNSNIFDQILNTTSNVTFNEINVSLIRSGDWTNVTITESQISDLQSYILTSNEGNLNVNRSDWWDNLNTPNDITSLTGITAINSTNWLNVTITESQISNLIHTTDTNETTRFNSLTNNDCSAGQLVIGVQANGTVLCATDDSGGGGGGNPFDQVLNTTSNVTFNEINVSLIRSGDWTNVTITESQISNLQSYILTWTLGGSSGTNQTITQGNIAFIAAGTGITTTAAATDKVTIAATLGTSIVTGEITDGTILEIDLNADNAPVNNDILTFDSTGNNFEWDTPVELGLIEGITTTATTSGLDGGCTSGTCSLTVDASDLTDTTNDGITTSGENFVVSGGTCLTADASGLGVTANCITDAQILQNTIDGSEIENDILDFVDFEDTLDLDSATQINVGTGEEFNIDLDGTADFQIRDVTTVFADFRNNGDVVLGNNNEFFMDTSTARVGIGTSTPQNTFNVIGVGNFTGDVFLGDSSGTDLTVGGGSGKIDVGATDPIYTIDGIRYATYHTSAIGLKEEVTGTVMLKSDYAIDFKSLEVGSELWLFYQVTDFGQNMEKLQVVLTPGFDGRVWYTKNPRTKTLTIHGNSVGEVSYRLISDRHDWATDWNGTYYVGSSNAKGYVLEGK